jgi:dethiobiotin synthetase
MPAMIPFRLFVTGTDTGVGKTEAACALLSLLADRGMNPAPFKPYESGCPSLLKPRDATALKRASRGDDALLRICPHRFRAPVAPGVAARRLRIRPSMRTTLGAFQSFENRSLIAEGAGGLFVPLDSKHEVIDLIELLGLAVLIVARSGLGTLNHTALSIEALIARRIPVRAVLLSRSDPSRDSSERDNSEMIRRRHRVPVLGPVPYERNSLRRRALFRRALMPLLQR